VVKAQELRIGDHAALEPRGDFFNLFNTNLPNPLGDSSSATFGKFTHTRRSALFQLGGHHQRSGWTPEP